ncbi:MAG: sulfotransferase domain-containing protein [Planctomycetota bacterium]
MRTVSTMPVSGSRRDEGMGEKRFDGKTDVRPLVRNQRGGLSQRTVLVVGQPRGGTSAVAGVLDALGVYMGPPAELRSGGSFESYVFVHGSASEKLAEVDRCNEEYDMWGWKQPFGISAMDLVPVTVRNLHCVFVMRDVAALAHAYVHHNNITQPQALKFAKGQNDALYDRFVTTDFSALLLSYERLKEDPAQGVGQVIGFLGMLATEAEIGEAVERISSSGGYVTMEETYGGPAPAPLPDRWKGHPQKSVTFLHQE